ncbi:MAG: flagellar type III secretion system pore protein FliP [Alphaproteobacteria bacterium]|nr:flagellar type III secretion system pore protein FliP [Rhodospirillales bacterium]MCW9046107.1 flagellar type III secretion system pore protein FliP [Alphaproteobacteria bacterium]
MKAKISIGVFVIGLVASGLIFMTQPAFAQSFTLDLGGDSSATTRVVQLIALTTVLSLAPSILIMMTSFTRIVIVFSFVRTALGTQQAPPNQVLISLALFLTLFIMMPTFEEVYDEALKPMMEGQMEEVEAFDRALVPFHRFMSRHVREQDLQLFFDIAKIDDTKLDGIESVPMKALIPAFMLSEIRRAFEIGFLIFVPFLVIDMVVASVLMSMGMMMLPPIIVALPFKIIFFVLVDGWYLLVGSLVKSFGG